MAYQRFSWLSAVATLGAVCAGLIAALALLGYVLVLPQLIAVRSGLQGMSPLTALALLALAVSSLAAARGRGGLTRLFAVGAVALVSAPLISDALVGEDQVSLWAGRHLFGAPVTLIGRTSVATAATVILVASSLVYRRCRAATADALAGIGLLISGMALLGYAYGFIELYRLRMFNSMALHTAVALFLLSGSAVLAAPEEGWAAVIDSHGAGGSATRRQLAFVLLPPVVGWGLLRLSEGERLGPGVAIALLVVLTIAPLALLILRDGRVLDELDRVRDARERGQTASAQDLRHQLEAQAEKLAAEGAERAKAEAAMYRAQRMEAVGQLTGGIAHDFNNLLMAIRGNLELIERRTADNERLQRYVASAIAAADKGAKITSQLLAFSRSQRLDIRSVELDPIIVSARELIGSALGPTIEIDMALGADGAWASTDANQLELALLNLGVNARDAMPDGGRLRIESLGCADHLAEEADRTRYVVVRVTDTGTGMSEEVLAKAMEPFFTTKTLGKGTGLGLAQVYGFVRQCGGDLRIASTPGHGTSIEILLPCAQPDIGATSGGDHGDKGQALAAGNGRSVVVIDDDESVRAVIVDALVNAGFHVLQASDGPSGLALLERISPAAAVIDFLMPGMNGAEVARAAQTSQPTLPIVFVSGYSDTVALEGISGAVVLRKPFDLQGLNRAVAAVLH